MIITINGKPGSGKSTVAKRLAEKLGYRRYDVGAMRRNAAREQGMTLEAFNRLGETSDVTDRRFDEYVQKLGHEQDNCVVEGRLAWRLIPHSLKIFLDVSEEVGARRIWHDLQKDQAERNEGNQLDTYDHVLESTRRRVQSDTLRYRKYYDIESIFDKRQYDLYLDTTQLSITEEFQKVFDFIQQELRSK